jgi:hypothetical protein
LKMPDSQLSSTRSVSKTGVFILAQRVTINSGRDPFDRMPGLRRCWNGYE